MIVMMIMMITCMPKARTPRLKESVCCAPWSETPGDTYEGTLATA